MKKLKLFMIAIIGIIITSFLSLWIISNQKGVNQEAGVFKVDMEKQGYQFLSGFIKNGEDTKVRYQVTLNGMEPKEEYGILLFGYLNSFIVYVDGKPVYQLNEKLNKRQMVTFTVEEETCMVIMENEENVKGGYSILPILFKWNTFQHYQNRTMLMFAFFTGLFLCYFIIQTIRKGKGFYVFLYSTIGFLCYLKNSMAWMLFSENNLPQIFNYIQNVAIDMVLYTVFAVFSVLISKMIIGNFIGKKKTYCHVAFLLTTTLLLLVLLQFGYIREIMWLHVVITGFYLVCITIPSILWIIRMNKMSWGGYYIIGMAVLFFGMMVERVRILGLAPFNMDFLLPTAICIYLFIFSAVSIEREKDVLAFGIEKNLLMDENEQQTIQLMISQIKPHFIYNVFLVIKHLCRNQTEEAESAIVRFSEYLRENVNSISTKHPIPLKQEIKHVKNFLYLEKIRFGNRVNVVWDVAEDEVEIPALTLQVLVENAIRHGIGKKEDGGTITISTKKGLQYFEIRVEDDGVGFDVAKEINSKEHSMQYSTLLNLRNRIRSIMDGEILYESKVGVGTVVIIQIPFHF